MRDTPDPSSSSLFSPGEVRLIVLGLTLALFLSSLDQTIVATALSTIAGDLGGWALLPWVVSAYLIASTVTTPIYGRLSDLYGRRPVLLVSISLFVLGAMLSALAQSMPMLILMRVVQGLGGGGLRAISLAVVGDILPPRERGKVQGYLSGTFATANICGPVLGGLFVEYLSWHWIFWINLPLGAAAFAATYFQLRRLPLPGKRPRIDWPGAALIVLACTPVLIGITLIQRSGDWLSPAAWGCFALGIAGTAALILQERAAPQPMLPLHLFRNGIFTTAIVITGLASMVMMALTVLVPLAYQMVAGLSAKQAGLRMIAMTLGSVSGSFLAGLAVTRTGRYRALPILGTSTALAMCLVVALVGLGHSLLLDTAVTLALGLGFGCQFSPITVTIQNAVDPRDGGVAVACMMFFRLMGGAFGVALLSALLLGRLGPGGTASPEQAAAAFSVVFLAAGGIAALCLIAALRLQEIPLRGRS
ncbi:MDR family MFS transporter [Paracraurococcus lichenis]|uniref:MDR family MFS transporter n=1 Tax=Paracraurococcus lichenis TaxID=3064888 RepID=A0ABT9DUJ7_9PROT|nr:MDR family MFS transporter [Paracraurococcus sp. LOR1-02]MDO9707575.1 MDR family MFS transporter [Paracraurococcus sp. LOR1-02]